MSCVEWSARFRRDMNRLRERAEVKPTGAHAGLFSMLNKVCDILSNVEHACGPGTALTGDLPGIYRWHVGPRGRLFYIVSRPLESTIVLFFGDTRRAGDRKNDAYAEFRRLIRSDEFDRCFAKLGLTKPTPKP